MITYTVNSLTFSLDLAREVQVRARDARNEAGSLTQRLAILYTRKMESYSGSNSQLKVQAGPYGYFH